MHYAVVDIGSPAKGSLGWWVHGPRFETGGIDPDAMIAAFSAAALDGPLALGFEAPMYVPAGRGLLAALRARPGEGNRSWSAGAGAAVTAMALAIVPSILGRLEADVPGIKAWQDWKHLPTEPKEVLVFEAFVSGGASDGHASDARLAAIAARKVLVSGDAASCLADEGCMSTLGAALLHSGLCDDITELHRPCLVVRADKVLTS